MYVKIPASEMSTIEHSAKKLKTNSTSERIQI